MSTRLYAGPMRQAITTKFRGPTDSSGSRVIASCEAGRVVYPWDHAHGREDNHYLAACMLANRFGWMEDGTRLIGGGIKDGFVWVLVDGPTAKAEG